MSDKIDWNDPINGYIQYTLGLRVKKKSKDENYYGIILSRFLTTSRELRFAVEIEGTGVIRIEKGADLYWIPKASQEVLKAKLYVDLDCSKPVIVN